MRELEELAEVQEVGSLEVKRGCSQFSVAFKKKADPD